MQTEFERALKVALVHEGGKIDHPRDPGGRTNQGVTQRVYDGWRVREGLRQQDVYLMLPAERDAIYRAQYWDRIRGDALARGVGYAVFDGAVNSGVGQAVKWLQRALGVQADGVMGAVTLAAIDAHPDHDRLIASMLDRRMAFLRALRTWGTFGKGWSRRVADVQTRGQAWAMGSVGPAVHYIPGADRKALIADAKQPPARAAGDVAAGVGMATATINEATGVLTPLADASPSIGAIVGLLTAAGVAVTLAGIGYRVWAKSRSDQLKDALDIGAPA